MSAPEGRRPWESRSVFSANHGILTHQDFHSLPVTVNITPFSVYTGEKMKIAPPALRSAVLLNRWRAYVKLDISLEFKVQHHINTQHFPAAAAADRRDVAVPSFLSPACALT